MSFIAITTRYAGATNTRGARVIVSAENGRVERITVPWDHRIGADQNHAAAARQLALKLGWHGAWYGGEIPRAMVFVRVPDGTNKSDSSFCC